MDGSTYAVLHPERRSLSELASVFLKIGAVGYGAAAIWALIQSEVQERRAWLSKERFLEGLAFVNVLPGAPAMQMCVFVGYQRAGFLGGVLAGLAFMAPAFAVVLLLSITAAQYGALPLMRDAFYGLSPVVLGIFAVAVYRLGRAGVKDAFSALMAAGAAAALAFSLAGVAGTLVLAGCLGVAMHHSRRRGLMAALVALALIGAERAAGTLLSVSGAGTTGEPSLLDVGLFFFKVGALTFGGGMTIIAFVQDQVVNQLHWITAQEFLECLMLSQFTPGPIIMVAAYVGYKVAGTAGAAVAACAIFLPSFILMLSVLPFLERVRELAWVKAAMRGIAPAVVGTIAVTVAQLAPHAAPDVFSAVVFVVTAGVLLAWRLPVFSLVLAGSMVGVLARSRWIHRIRELA
ncbi:MAG TPA: chromate efflux transporter [Burkholderiales bacterium]|nr:chromate efflux transporter [Burkholderiales bacterium]